MYTAVSRRANLGLVEGIGLPNGTVPLNDAIVRGLFRNEIQGALQRFAGGLGAKRLLSPAELRGI
jgi:hypothetical protein